MTFSTSSISFLFFFPHHRELENRGGREEGEDGLLSLAFASGVVLLIPAVKNWMEWLDIYGESETAVLICISTFLFFAPLYSSYG